MNKAIAEQKGVAIEDLAIQNPVSAEATVQNEPSTPETPRNQQSATPRRCVIDEDPFQIIDSKQILCLKRQKD